MTYTEYSKYLTGENYSAREYTMDEYDDANHVVTVEYDRADYNMVAWLDGLEWRRVKNNEHWAQAWETALLNRYDRHAEAGNVKYLVEPLPEAERLANIEALRARLDLTRYSSKFGFDVGAAPVERG